MGDGELDITWESPSSTSQLEWILQSEKSNNVRERRVVYVLGGMEAVKTFQPQVNKKKRKQEIKRGQKQFLEQ